MAPLCNQSAESDVEQTYEYEEATYEDIIRAFQDHAEEEKWDLSQKIYGYTALSAYTLAHPVHFLRWADDSLQISGTLQSADKMRRLLHTYAENIDYSARVAAHFLLSWRSPEGCAKRALAQGHIQGDRLAVPPRLGLVRVKWYPTLESVQEWPENLGDLWTRVPRDASGSIDLRPVMKMWGMQNCYVLDLNRTPGDRQRSRRPVEKLSALAVAVLLMESRDLESICVLEMPSPALQAARRAHAWLATISILQVLSIMGRYVLAIPYFALTAVSAIVTLVFYFLYDISLPLRDILTCGLMWVVRPITSMAGTLFHWLTVALMACYAASCWSLKTTKLWAIALVEAAFLNQEEINSLSERPRSERTRSSHRRRRHSQISNGDEGLE